MINEALIYFSIYVLCMFKIIFGPTMGYAAGIHPLITSVITISGMMTTILIFSLLGERLRHTAFIRFFKFKKVF